MAFEKVLMVNNTSVMPDEVLAHRLGLLPLDADPRLFEYLSENETPNEKNTIVFKLDVSCKKGDPRMPVKSGHLKWLPNGSELLMEAPNPSAKPKSYTSFTQSQDSMPEFSQKPIALKNDDIYIDKLGPGQVSLASHYVIATIPKQSILHMPFKQVYPGLQDPHDTKKSILIQLVIASFKT